MSRLRPFLLGTLSGLLLAALTLTLGIRFLPNLLVVRHAPAPADAILVLGGDADGSRLRMGLKLHDDKLAPRLLLVGNSSKAWESIIRKNAPGGTLEGRGAIFIEGSTDTRTDAELTLQYALANNLHTLLVVTSPYHTRRAQFIFNDIAENPVIRDQLSVSSKTGDQLSVIGDQKYRDQDKQGPKATDHGSRITDHASIKLTVISSGDYGRLVPPDGRWWRDRRTMETVWLEFGKILYWELTPFMEFQGEEEKSR